MVINGNLDDLSEKNAKIFESKIDPFPPEKKMLFIRTGENNT